MGTNELELLLRILMIAWVLKISLDVQKLKGDK